MDDGRASWDHMTFNSHVLIAVASSPGSKCAETKSLVLNLAHEAVCVRERERERERGRERKRKLEGEIRKECECVRIRQITM